MLLTADHPAVSKARSLLPLWDQPDDSGLAWARWSRATRGRSWLRHRLIRRKPAHLGGRHRPGPL